MPDNGVDSVGAKKEIKTDDESGAVLRQLHKPLNSLKACCVRSDR